MPPLQHRNPSAQRGIVLELGVALCLLVFARAQVFRLVRLDLAQKLHEQVGLLDVCLDSSGKFGAALGIFPFGHDGHAKVFQIGKDLLPLVVDEKWKAEIAKQLPELPEARRARMVREYGITEYDAGVLTASKNLADQFEEAAAAAKNPKRVANLVQSELMGRLKPKGLEIEQSPISMQGVALSADLVESGAISGKMLKDLYDLCFERNQDFPAVYEKEKPQQITDSSALEKIIDAVIAANPKQVEQYRAGKKTVMGFFVGQIMKATQGQANPKLVNDLLSKKLG